MDYIVFDLETVADPDMGEWSPKPGARDTFPPPPYHQIACCGVLRIKSGRAVQLAAETDEATALAKLAERWPTASTTRPLVSWGGRNFDVPVICARSMKHGVPLRSHYGPKYGTRYRFSTDHLDLCEELCDYGGGRKYTLDDAAKLIGWPGKVAGHGSDVQALHDAGKTDEIVNYCLTDVVQTAAVLARFERLRGHMTDLESARLIQDLHDLVATDARLVGLRSSMSATASMAEEPNQKGAA